mgnify:CR=1 FL=1
MQNFEFYAPTRMIFGKDTHKQVGKLVKEYGFKKVFVHFGGASAKKSGLLDTVLDALKAENIDYVTLGGVQANPTLAMAREGIELGKKEGADFILAVGGGSVMDCCKAISLGAKYDADIWADFWARLGVIDFELLPLGIIVTVSGTGSECNGGAVITNEELKIKTGKDYPKLNAKFVMLDPTYTYSVPKFQMVSGAFDTLSHIMEIYFSEPNESNVSDDISEALMKNVITNLRAAIKNPEDYTARSNLMWDATMAENRIIKLGKKTDFECHQMEHQLGAYTNCNHGAGLAVLHPVYYRHICKAGEKKFAQFAVNVWGISKDGKTDEELAKAGVEALANFIKEIGMPTTFKELGIDENINLKEIADSCGIVPGAYKKMTHEEILQIFEECK